MQSNLKDKNNNRGVDLSVEAKGQNWMTYAKTARKDLDVLLVDSCQLTEQLLEESEQEKRIHYFEQGVDQLLQNFPTPAKSEEIKIQLWKGQSYEILGAWHKALPALQRVIDLCDSEEVMSQKAKAYRFIGHIQMRQNRFDKALKSYEESLMLTRDCGDEKGQAGSYNGLASYYFEKGMLSKAISHWGKALQLAEKMNEIRLQADLNNNLGIAASVAGNWERALAYYEESLQRYKKISDSRGLAKTHHNMARTYADAECWAKAGIHYEKAHKLAKEVGDVHAQANIKLNRAELYIAIGDFNQAKALCQRALRTYLQLEDHLGKANVLKIMSVIYTKNCDWSAAQSYLAESIRLAQQFNGPLIEAEARFQYGRMWKEKGNKSFARKQYELALNLFTQINAQKQAEKTEQEIADLEHPHKKVNML